MLKLFASLGNYFRWFHTSNKCLSLSRIQELIADEPEMCGWVDALGRRVLLRRNAFGEAKLYLDNLTESELHERDKRLRQVLLDIINDNETDAHFIERFILPDDGGEGKDLPIPIFSSITPHHPARFLLHVSLVCGEYKTELDIRNHPSTQESLAACKVIGHNTDVDSILSTISQVGY